MKSNVSGLPFFNSLSLINSFDAAVSKTTDIAIASFRNSNNTNNNKLALKK